MKKRLPPHGLAELIFDALYLIAVLTLGVYTFFTAKTGAAAVWGAMALALATGDAFHLTPRMAAKLTGDGERYIAAQGIGKLMTSVTMTVFYLMLWHCGLMMFSLEAPLGTAVVYALALLRITLCLLPQNGWTKPQESARWGIYRNIPFALQGAMVLWLYAKCATGTPRSLMWLAVLLSFLFYIPVVLLAHRYPKLGMLMLPKSCAYVWIITMGLTL